MSNEAETMKKKSKRTLTPKLRFPEFRNEPVWEEKTGDSLFDQINDRNPAPDLPVLAITQEYGAIPRDMIDYHVSVTEKSIESYKVVQVGDFIISLRSFQGGIEYSQYHGICSPAYVILRRRTGGSDAYFKHYLKTDRFIRVLTRNLEGLRDGKMISYKQFSELLLPVPSPPEQQKIADCLSSLDGLIAAEGRKLEALKAHKKGLMQQLFPQPGQTQPSLRFTEFRDKGEWEVLRLGRLAKRITTRNANIGQSRVLTNSAELGVVDQGKYFDREIVTKGNLDGYYIVEKGDFVYNPRISNLAPVGPVSRNDLGTGVMSPLYTVFRFSAPSTDYFVQLFKTSVWHPYLKETSNSGARHDRMNITAADFMNLPLPVPSTDEQHRIAICFTALDDRIAAHAATIDALKQHKRGLMQQLFPAPEEQ